MSAPDELGVPEPADSDREPLRKRRARDIVFQLIGFVVGIALIVWCVEKALEGGGAEIIGDKLAKAPWWLIAAMLATTLASLLASGAIFWSLVRPVRPLGMGEVQAVNLLASFLNYAPLPLRLGLVARVAYHWRVNRMGPGLIGAWLLAALVNVGVAFVAVGGAMWFAPTLGLGGVAVVAIMLSAIGVVIVRRLSSLSFVAKHMRGYERMLSNPLAFGSSIAYRLVDIAAWAARMVCAVAILDIPVTASQAALLGLTAVVASMNPLGRFGFREAAVAWVATTIFEGSMTTEELVAVSARLALLESAAEGLVVVPIGVVASLWCWQRFHRAGPRTFGRGAAEQAS